METAARYRGSLLGLAVGDALGTTLEFRAPGTFAPIEDMVGGGPFRLKPGEWTDDTSMALCISESMIERQGFDPADQMARYVRWYRQGYLSSTGKCFDIGNTVRSALLAYEQTGQPYAGATHLRSAGNGSIMRLAPVPLFFVPHPEQAIHLSGESSRTTHGLPVCADACRYLGALIVGAVNGASKEELLSERFSPIPGYWERDPLVPEIDEIARGSYKSRQPPNLVLFASRLTSQVNLRPPFGGHVFLSRQSVMATFLSLLALRSSLPGPVSTGLAGFSALVT